MYNHRLKFESMKMDMVLVLRHSFKGKLYSSLRTSYYHGKWNKNNLLLIINGLMDAKV